MVITNLSVIANLTLWRPAIFECLAPSDPKWAPIPYFYFETALPRGDGGGDHRNEIPEVSCKVLHLVVVNMSAREVDVPHVVSKITS
jgi:hypothetical protein